MDAIYSIDEATAVKGTEEHRFALVVPHLRIGRGDRLALVGPSGCGKSTLLDMLALVLLPDRVGAFSFRPANDTMDLRPLIAGRGLDALGTLRQRHTGYVLQTGGLLPFLSVAGNIALPRRLLGLADDGTVARLAERLGIARHLRKHPAELSVGERQRVAIARALAHRPAVVLADEPTAALDPENSDTVIGLIVDLAEREGTTVVVASHDRDRVARFGLTAVNQEFLGKDATGCVRSAFWN